MGRRIAVLAVYGDEQYFITLPCNHLQSKQREDETIDSLPYRMARKISKTCLNSCRNILEFEVILKSLGLGQELRVYSQIVIHRLLCLSRQVYSVLKSIARLFVLLRKPKE